MSTLVYVVFFLCCASGIIAAQQASNNAALQRAATDLLAQGGVPYAVTNDATIDLGLAVSFVVTTLAKQPVVGEQLATQIIDASESNSSAAFAAHLCRAHARGHQFKFDAAREDLDAADVAAAGGNNDGNDAAQRQRHRAFGHARAATGDLVGAVDAFKLSCASSISVCQRVMCTTEAGIEMSHIAVLSESLLQQVPEADVESCERVPVRERYWLVRGKQEYRIGKMEPSVRSLDKCLSYTQVDNEETVKWTSPFCINCASMLAILYTDLSVLPDAQKAYAVATRVDAPNRATLESRRGKLYKLFGLHKLASDDFESCAGDGDVALQTECTVLAAQSHHVRGEFKRALQLYTRVIGDRASPWRDGADGAEWTEWRLSAWQRRELLLVECDRRHGDTHAQSISDASYAELLQGAMLGSPYMSHGYISLYDSKRGRQICPERIEDETFPGAAAAFRAADALGPLFQVAAPGFAESRWRQTAFSLAAIEVAQTLVAAADDAIDTDGGEDAGSDFRAGFSIPLRWRQSAASDDTAFWLDDMVSSCTRSRFSLIRLSKPLFSYTRTHHLDSLQSPEGFKAGSFVAPTPLQNKQYEQPRYRHYIARALLTMKESITAELEAGEISDHASYDHVARMAVQASFRKPTSADRVRLAMTAAKADAGVIAMLQEARGEVHIHLRIESAAFPGVTLIGPTLIAEATDATVLNPHIYIQTQAEPVRWAPFLVEMTHHWRSLRALVARQRRFRRDVRDAEGNSVKRVSHEEGSRMIEVIEFYWHNWMPLSRGSAGVARSMSLAIARALGYSLEQPLSDADFKGMQPDFEAILCRRVECYRASSYGRWLRASLQPLADGGEDGWAHLPSIHETFGTIAQRLAALRFAAPIESGRDVRLEALDDEQEGGGGDESGSVSHASPRKMKRRRKGRKRTLGRSRRRRPRSLAKRQKRKTTRRSKGRHRRRRRRRNGSRRQQSGRRTRQRRTRRSRRRRV
jgi:hypothetical protein